MSGILTNHYERLGIRVWQEGLLHIWDGNCGKEQTKCVECTLTLPSFGKRQTLTTVNSSQL